MRDEDWFQNHYVLSFLQLPKSVDALVPFIKQGSTVSPLHPDWNQLVESMDIEG